MILVGVDTGVKTGVGVWCTDAKKILDVTSGTLIEMYHYINDLHALNPDWRVDKEVFLRIEDARKRKWFGSDSRGKAQGAGSIKRDCAIWDEICQYHNWDYQMVHPIKGATKLKSQQFKQITKWEGRTNEHSRDALMLVYGLGRIRHDI